MYQHHLVTYQVLLPNLVFQIRVIYVPQTHAQSACALNNVPRYSVTEHPAYGTLFKYSHTTVTCPVSNTIDCKGAPGLETH